MQYTLICIRGMCTRTVYQEDPRVLNFETRVRRETSEHHEYAFVHWRQYPLLSEVEKTMMLLSDIPVLMIKDVDWQNPDDPFVIHVWLDTTADPQIQEFNL